MCRGSLPQAAELAGRVGDGYRLAMPDADLVRASRAAGGGTQLVQAGMKVNWTPTATSPRRLRTAPVGHLHAAVGDQRQASNCPANSPYHGQRLRRRHDAGIAWRGRRDHRVRARPRPARGPKVEAYADAGVDEAYVQQIGPRQAGFFAAWDNDVLPRSTRNPLSRWASQLTPPPGHGMAQTPLPI